MRSFKGMNPKELGLLLKKYRKTNGYKQQEVADAIGIGRSSYSKYENGTRRIEFDSIIRLSVLYNVSLDAFFAPFVENGGNAVSDLPATALLVSSPDLSEIDDSLILPLSADEKKLILYYRSCFRKNEIMDNAYEILCSDAAIADEIQED